MAEVLLAVSKREPAGKGAAKKLRAQGLAPAVVYGRGKEPVTIAVQEREFFRRFGARGESNALVRLELAEGGEGMLAMVYAVQTDAISGRLLNVDFHQVALDEKVQATVPVVLQGEPAGHKEGGILSQAIHEVKVECLPTEVPVRLEADVSHLQIGDAVHLADVQLPEGVVLHGHRPEDVVAQVSAPVARITEEAEEAVAEGAEGEGETVAAETEETV